MAPITVCVTGAAGQIAYSLLFNIANGYVFGATQEVNLHLLDIPDMIGSLEGVKMELQDCAMPLLKNVVATADPKVAFKDCEVALLVGAMPRKQGMERKDLLKANASIFKHQGLAINEVAKKDIKILVVGNPANTNCLILSHYAKDIPKENFSALTRLDHSRARAQIALKAGVSVEKVKNVIIWGNHSSTQYPDVSNAYIAEDGKKVPVAEKITDHAWLQGEYISVIQQRGAAVIAARKLSSAMSAAKAICDHTKDWWQGTPDDEYVSMAVISDGNPYGVPDGLIYSFPCRCKNGKYTIVEGIPISDFSKQKMQITTDELVQEKTDAFAFVESS